MPRGSGSSRRPRAEAPTKRETVASGPAATPAIHTIRRRQARARSPALRAGREGVAVIEPLTHAEQVARLPAAGPRFQIVVIDAGWDSPAHRVLQRNFGLLRELQEEGEPIYVLNRQKSIEFIRQHSALLAGRDPIIIVHDLDALAMTDTVGFRGFRLHLGLLRTENQALLALQAFSRFLSANRRSADLEAVIRTQLRREGFLGAIEIIMQESREISG